MSREWWLPYLLLLWLGGTVLSDEFPVWSWKHPFYFRKQNHDESCCCNEENNEPMCFTATLRLQLSSFHSGKILLLPSGPLPRFTKTCLAQFQSCVKTLLGHNVPFHEKGGQKREFCGCWMPYLCLLISESVLSNDFPARSDMQTVPFRKHKTKPKLLWQWRKKWISVIFRQDWGCNYQASTWKILL